MSTPLLPAAAQAHWLLCGRLLFIGSGIDTWTQRDGAEQLAGALRVLCREPRGGALVTTESLDSRLCDALVVWFAIGRLEGAMFSGAAVLLNHVITYWSFLMFSGPITLPAGFGEVILRVQPALRSSPDTASS